MASRARRATPTNNFGPDSGGNIILAAWQGLYHLFGARVERFDVTDEGVTAVGLTVSDKYDMNTIVQNLLANGSKRRLNFFPLFFWATGGTPAPFTTSLQLTGWMTTFLKGQGEKGRSPKYAKEAIDEFKAANGLAVPRGRPRTTLSAKIAKLGELNPEVLQDTDIAELVSLRETLDNLVSSKA